MSTAGGEVDADRGQGPNGPTATEKTKERMRQWYLTRGKEQRKRRRALTGTLPAKQHRPNTDKPNDAGYPGPAEIFSPEYHATEYNGVFDKEEVETIKDIVFDYLAEIKEPKGGMGGIAAAVGTVAAPALIKTAFDNAAVIKRVGGAFLGRWLTPPNGVPSNTQSDLSSQTDCQPPSSLNACVDENARVDENVVIR